MRSQTRFRTNDFWIGFWCQKGRLWEVKKWFSLDACNACFRNLSVWVAPKSQKTKTLAAKEWFGWFLGSVLVGEAVCGEDREEGLWKLKSSSTPLRRGRRIDGLPPDPPTSDFGFVCLGFGFWVCVFVGLRVCILCLLSFVGLWACGLWDLWFVVLWVYGFVCVLVVIV